MADYKKLFSAIESDNRMDATHPTMATGIQKGTKAIGELGIMPNTAQLMAKRKVRDGIATPLDEIIATANPKDIEELLASNPDKYQEYAKNAINDVKQRSKDDPMEDYFRYNFGPNKDSGALQGLIRSHPDLVQRVEDKIGEQHMTSEPDKYIDSLAIPAKEQLFSKIKGMVGK